MSDNSSIWRIQWWHVVLLCVGFLLRIGCAYHIGKDDPFGGWDGREYYGLATHLLSFQGFDYPRFFNFIRAPGYPLFLMPFIALSPHGLWPIQLANCLLGVFQVLLLAWITSQWAGPRAANYAFSLAVFHPFLFYFGSFIQTESLFITLLWLGIAGMQKFDAADRSISYRWVVWSGLALGLACLVRPCSLSCWLRSFGLER